MNSINKQISKRCRFFNQLLEMYMRQYSKIISPNYEDLCGSALLGY